MKKSKSGGAYAKSIKQAKAPQMLKRKAKKAGKKKPGMKK